MIRNLWNLSELGLPLNIFMNLLLSEPILHSRQLLYSQRSSEGEGSSRPMSCRPCGSAMECASYLWRSSPGEGGGRPTPHCICGEALQEKVAVHPHFVAVERDESRIVFVAKLPRRRWQLTCPSSSLRIEVCFMLRRVLDCS